jgi:DNA-binding CsgD family transcriptional regulator
MAKRKRRIRSVPSHAPHVRLDRDEWLRVVRSLHLSRQQTRIIELVLQARSDKQIATELGLRLPTVRTYLRRLYVRNDCSSRVGLILRVFACLRE